MKPVGEHRVFQLMLLAALLSGASAAGLCVPTQAHAQTSESSELIARTERPTIGDLKAALQPWPKVNPFPGAHNLATQNFEIKLAQYIAEMEFAYRGLIFAPIGRDTVLFGDMIDAFYESIGERGRVQRINVSSPSFDNANPERLVNFMMASGFVDPTPESKPLIFIDSSNYTETSQSVRLMTAVYDDYARRHGTRKPLIRKFNMINLYSPGGIPITAKTKFERYFSEMESQVDKTLYPKKILSLSDSPTNFQFVYATEWHERFRSLHEDLLGRVVSLPGKQSPIPTKQQVLFEQFEIIRRMRGPTMLERVRAEASQLGYVFPTPGLRPDSNCDALLDGGEGGI